MRISIVIPIYNSHKVVDRQVKYFNRMKLANDIEFIFVDDGSNPSLNPIDYELDNLSIVYTNDKRPWTQGLARNKGAKYASGEYLFMTDIDHILSIESINEVYCFDGNKMIFPREFGILDEEGYVLQNTETLVNFGLDINRINSKRGLYASVHGNTFAIKHETFKELGGYNPKYCTYGHHAPSRGGEDSAFNKTWNHWAAKKGIQVAVGPKIYLFPTGRYNIIGDLNPQGLFNNLSQEQTIQPMKG